MPVPMEYVHASQDFDRFMLDARQQLNHATTHQTFQTVQSVLIVFRRRLEVAEALAFADVLPAVLRAIFVSEWDVDEDIRPFTDRQTLTKEVQQFRRNHDFSPDTAIEDVAAVLRRHVDVAALDNVLTKLLPGAAHYWSSPARETGHVEGRM